MLIVEPGNPRDAQTAALLRQSHALMEALFPAEDNFYLDIDALCGADIRFFVAREGRKVLGTGALALKQGYAEIKSMFVAEDARGRGVADAILRALEDTARDEGVTALKLETGDVLYAAHRLYRRHGFTDCDSFGDYGAAGSSIFMEKALIP